MPSVPRYANQFEMGYDESFYRAAHTNRAVSATNSHLHTSEHGSQDRPPHHAPWQNNWRDTERQPHSFGPPDSSQAPEHTQSFVGQNAVHDPSFYSYSGVPVKGAASTNFTNGTMPKNFTQPLTCFYWYNGSCSKSDDECLYAHYETGVVAAAPVSLRGNRGAVAGRNAMQQLHDQTEKDEELKKWEARLIGKEMDLGRKLADAHKLDQLADSIGTIYDIIVNGKAAVEKARRSLNIRREEVAATVSEPVVADGTSSGRKTLDALDAAIGAAASIELDFITLEHETEAKFGKTTAVSAAVQVYLDAGK